MCYTVSTIAKLSRPMKLRFDSNRSEWDCEPRRQNPPWTTGTFDRKNNDLRIAAAKARRNS